MRATFTDEDSCDFSIERSDTEGSELVLEMDGTTRYLTRENVVELVDMLNYLVRPEVAPF